MVLAGDIAPLKGRGPWHINDQKKWINKRFREWTSSYPGIQFVVIPGNRSLQTDSEHFGSSELTEAIIEKRPRLVFCGHIHTGQHGGVDFESTSIYNVSRLDERYEIAYEPTLVDI